MVVAAPLFNRSTYLQGAVESLLAQSYSDFSLILVDDCSSDETPALAEAFAARDERVTFARNERRLGMIGTWRRAFDLALELVPSAEFFAWGSDHDRWHPEWLRSLVEELDRAPQAVLAYPQSVRITETDEVVRGPWEFDTAGVSTPGKRLRSACLGMAAGSMVYGLYRAAAVARAGTFRRVLNPDRLLLAELSLQGEFRQVPVVLWERRFTGLASRARQRRSFFPDGVPWHAYLASWPVHASVLLWTYAVRGAARPTIGRLHGLGLTFEFLFASAGFELRRTIARSRKRMGRLRKTGRRMVKSMATSRRS